MFDDKGGEMYPKSKQIVWGRNANSLGEKCTLNDAISKGGGMENAMQREA